MIAEFGAAPQPLAAHEHALIVPPPQLICCRPSVNRLQSEGSRDPPTCLRQSSENLASGRDEGPQSATETSEGRHPELPVGRPMQVAHEGYERRPKPADDLPET